MKSLATLSLLSFLLTSFLIPDNNALSFQNKSGKIEIRIGPVEKQISYPFQSAITVIITNNTDSIASFYEDWNSWGHDNLFLKIITKDTTFTLHRPYGDPSKNYPSFKMLFPGDSLKLFFEREPYKDEAHVWHWFVEHDFIDSKIVACYELVKENHTLGSVNYMFTPSNHEDSVKLLKLYKTFPLDKLESAPVGCDIKKGIITVKKLSLKK